LNIFAASLALCLTCVIIARAQQPECAPHLDVPPIRLEQLWLPPVDLPQQGKLIITLRVCAPSDGDPGCQIRRAEWQRVKDEVDLHGLILEDLRNTKAGRVDYSLRSRIKAISRRLADNRYE